MLELICKAWVALHWSHQKHES